MPARAHIVLLIAAALLMVGCIGATDEATLEPTDGSTDTDQVRAAGGDGHDHEADGHTHAGEVPPFSLELQDCREAGGISIYNSEEGAEGPTEPFLLANMKEDVGSPVIGTYGQPIVSDFTIGIWHMAGVCASYSVNGEPGPGEFRYGWVGMKVLPPAFDADGPERQYFVTDLSIMDADIVEFLREEVGIHATRMLEGGVEDIGPDTINVVMNDEDHGIFESHLKMRPYQEMVIEPFRFWLYIPADGDLGHSHSHDASGVEGVKYRPVSLHIENHGNGTHEVVDGTGWFSHSRTNHHGEGVNGASGNVAGLQWDGFDRTITLGPMPDVVYDETWLH